MKKLVEKLEGLLELGGIKKDVTLLVISGAAVLMSLAGVQPFSFDIAWVAIILCGLPIILEAVIGLVTAFDIKADVLVSMALIASVCIGEYFAAGEVALIMQLGALLEELTVARARAGIEKLVHLTPQTARLLEDGAERTVPAQEVRVGDLLRVLPGESVPVDGVIVAGQTSINQAVMTGESLPADKTVGDEVASGTVNQFGAFDMRATKVGEDSSIQRMIRLVQSADAGKAKIVGLADRWATWIVVIALTAAALTWLISGEIIRAVTILVVFCPCACAGNADCHHGRHRQRDEARLPRPRGGRARAPGQGRHSRLRQDRDADLRQPEGRRGAERARRPRGRGALPARGLGGAAFGASARQGRRELLPPLRARADG